MYSLLTSIAMKFRELHFQEGMHNSGNPVSISNIINEHVADAIGPSLLSCLLDPDPTLSPHSLPTPLLSYKGEDHNQDQYPLKLVEQDALLALFSSNLFQPVATIAPISASEPTLCH